MDFIEALIQIHNSNGTFELCDDPTELDGRHPSICVFKNGEFLGKLRWPKDGKPAEVDECLKNALNKESLNYPSRILNELIHMRSLACEMIFGRKIK